MSDSTWIFTYVGIAADWPTMHWLIARDGALRGMWLRPSRRIDWVGAEPVLKELGIEKSKEKVAKLAQLTQRFQEERNSRLSKLTPKELNRRGPTIQKELRAKANLELQQILTRREYARLEQIDWQAAGPRALQYVEIVKALALRKKQRQSLSSLARKTSRLVKTLLSAGGTPRPKKDKELNSVFVALKAEHEKEAGKILSPTQRKKFARLKGKPASIPLEHLRPSTEVRGTTVVIDIKNAGLMVTLETRGWSSLVTAATGPHRHEVITTPGEQSVTITVFSSRPIRHLSSNESFSVQSDQTRTLVVSLVGGQVSARVDNDSPLTFRRGLARQR
jgi:hypothetical protein